MEKNNGNADTENANIGNGNAENTNIGNVNVKNANIGNANAKNANVGDANGWNIDIGNVNAGNIDIGNKYVKNLNRIEFLVTMECTGKCKHCSEGNHEGFSGCIETDAVVTAIREVCRNYEIKSLMTFGGEALLYPDVVCAIHNTAKKMGVPQRDLITNGYFSKDSDIIKEVVTKLEESGVANILLSVDAFHQETIPLEPVVYFAECVVKSSMNIKLNPAWLVSKEDNNPYNVRTKEIIREFESLKIPVGIGNVIFPEGNALKNLGEYFETDKEYVNPYEDNPRDVRTISFSPNGEVLDGNIYEKGILEIIKEYQP